MKDFMDKIFIPPNVLENIFISCIMSGRFPDAKRSKGTLLFLWLDTQHLATE